MVINFTGVYKSLKTFISDDLGSFAIITGKNGSGKSQLVQLMNIYKNPQSSPLFKISIEPILKNIQVEGIALTNVQALKGEQIAKQLETSLSSFSQLQPEVKTFIEELLINGIKLNEITSSYDFRPYMKGQDILQKNERIIEFCRLFFGPPAYNHKEDLFEQSAKKIAERLFSLKKIIQSASNVAIYRNKRLHELNNNDFYSSPLEETYYTNDTPFSAQIEHLFYGYARKRFVNEMEFNRMHNYGLQNGSISDREFIKLYPPPWEQINHILEKHGLKLRVVEIKPEIFSPEIRFDFHIVDIVNGKKITFEELSSGEKIIVGLVIRLFLTTRYRDELRFPDCIVFDEPDAFLHPEMSSLLIDVLYNTFVKELGIKVIFTTHSPSTVALTPDDCIYELINVPETSLKKISKDNALKVLTENLPLLSIDYKNHRQIFVESPTDQYYYQSIFNKLKAEEKTLYDLYFITTGYGKSDCAQVIKLTQELRQAGNKTSFGIIDWDEKNEPLEFVKVNGYLKRYSVENFIYDPLHLCILFLDQRCANGIGKIGFDETYNQYSLANESNERLQVVTDWFFTRLKEVFPAIDNETVTVIGYANGKTTSLPQWYLMERGHDVEGKLRKAFPSLTAFQGEGVLQKKLTQIASKCYPFIPVDSLEVIQELANK